MYYKINVYKLENKINKSVFLTPTARDDRRKYEYLDNIIIEEAKDGTYREIYTEQEIDLFNKDSIDKKGLINDKCINYRKLREDGIQIFTFEEELTKENIATGKDLDEYFRTFFDSNYKKTFDTIDMEREKSKVKQKRIFK